jgi:hypothetical protein
MQDRALNRSALKLEWAGSRCLALVLALAHALSIAAVLSLHMAGWGKALAIALLSVSTWFYVSRELKPSSQRPWRHAPRLFTALELKSNATSAARTSDGQWHEAQLAAVVAAPLLTIVQVKLEGRRWPRFIVLTPDMLAREDYRRLQVRLRWSSLGEAIGL